MYSPQQVNYDLFSTAGNMTLLRVWGAENGPWMQALHFICGCGALISPLLASPFLNLQSPNGSKNLSISLNETWVPKNASMDYQVVNTLPTALQNVTMNYVIPQNNMSEAVVTSYDSNVHWAYLIIGLCLCISALLFGLVTLFCSDIRSQCLNEPPKSPIQKSSERQNEEKNERVFRLKLTTFVFFFYFFYCIVERNYLNYLSTYVVKDLEWTEREGARLTSGYLATFILGRAIGIIVVKVLLLFTFIQLFILI